MEALVLRLFLFLAVWFLGSVFYCVFVRRQCPVRRAQWCNAPLEGLSHDLRFDTPVAPTTCDTIDFNGDTLFPDTQDIADFLTVFAGGA